MNASNAVTSRSRFLRLSAVGLSAGGLALAAACAGTAGSPGEEEAVATAEQGLTCVTVENVGPSTTPVDDAEIISDPADPTKANTSYGTIQQMNVGQVGTGSHRVLLRFDVPSVNIPAGATIASATLKLRMIQSLGKEDVDLYAMTAPWSEASVTWNSVAAAPNGGLGALQATLSTLGVPNNSGVDIALPSALIQGWMTPATNYGLVLDHPASGRTTLGSSEAPTPGPRPKLQICYEPPSCSDGAQNQGESGVDCGGPCPPCGGGTIGTLDNPGLSCSDILDQGGSSGSGLYWIHPAGDPSAFQAFCEMSEDGGGWTLVMKIDGNSSTFTYHSPYWTDPSATYNEGHPEFDAIEARLHGFSSVPFSALRLGMRDGGVLRWLVVPATAPSLLAAANAPFAPTSVGRGAWSTLVANPALQPNCNAEGFNAPGNLNHSRVRIGITANNENDCGSCDSFIGFGGLGMGCGTTDAGNYTGNWMTCEASVNDRTFGYILVR